MKYENLVKFLFLGNELQFVNRKKGSVAFAEKRLMKINGARDNF